MFTILNLKLYQNKESLGLVGIPAAFVSGLLLILFLVEFHFLSFTIERDDYRLLLSTSATIIATILAVSFSISILGIQHALGSFAPSLLKHFVSDKATIISFTILSFSSVICLIGLILPWTEIMASLSLYLLPYGFIVLAYYFYARSKTTTSITLFEILKKEVRKYIDRELENNLQYEMQEALKSKYLGKAMSKMNEEQIETITDSLFHTSNILRPIKNCISDVIGLIHRSLPSNDYESIENGLGTLGDIIENYIAVRRPSADDKIIESLYEQIKSITIVALVKKNPYLIKKIVKTYERIALLSTELPLPPTVKNYQFTVLALYYLNEIFYTVGSLADVDLEVIRSIRNIGTSSTLHGGDDVLSIYYLSEMALNPEGIKQLQFYREIIGAIAQKIRCSIEMKVNEIQLRLHLEKFTHMSITIIKRLQENDAHIAIQPILDTTFLNVSYGFPNNCYVMVIGLLNLKKTVDDDFFSRTLEKYAFESVPDIILSVIQISSAAVEKKYAWIVRDAAKSLYKITVALLGEKFLLQLNFDKEIREIIYSIISFFIRFFKTDDDLNYENLFGEILDTLTMMGLQFILSKRFDLTNLVSKQIFAICSHVAKFDEFGYSTARIAERIMIIGIFSIEVNADHVTKKVLELLDSYDTEVKNIVKEFQPRIWALDELERENSQYDPLFNLTEISPKSFLKQRVSYYAWSKFRSIIL